MVKANISWSVKQIAKAVVLGSMVFDNVIQRGHVWDLSRKCLLVDSILRNYPVPPMFTIKTDIDAPEGCKKGSKVFDCIDGKQRAETFRAFRNNEFALEGLDPFIDINGNEVDLNGKTYAELDEDMQDAFDSYTMTVYFFTEISDDEVADMMSRLNNGKPLTNVENARIKACNIDAIINLANHNLFTENMTAVAIKGYNNEDVVIKTALQAFENEHDLSSKKVKYGYENIAFTNNQKEQLEKVFSFVYDVINKIKENNKKVARKILKKTNLVCVCAVVAEMKITDVDKFASFLIDFFGVNQFEGELGNYQREYTEACVNGTNHASNVLTRNDNLGNCYSKYIE